MHKLNYKYIYPQWAIFSLDISATKKPLPYLFWSWAEETTEMSATKDIKSNQRLKKQWSAESDTSVKVR